MNKAIIDLLISGQTHKYGIHPMQAGQHNFSIVIGGGPKAGQCNIIKVKADQKTLALEFKLEL